MRWGAAKQDEINADIRKMFAEDTETAIGVRTYCSMTLRAEYALIFSTQGGGILWNGSAWGDFKPDHENTSAD